jgi:glutamyl-tRNA synthetase
MGNLRFLNREQLYRMDYKAISGLYGFADTSIGQLIKLYLQEASTLSELDTRIKPFFTSKPCDGDWGEEMHTIAHLIPNAPFFEAFNDFKAYIMGETGLKEKQLSKPLRLILTGTEHGPELDEVYPLIRSYITEVARCPH